MNTSLAGKRALVCGSTQGIGLAAAVELATQGASVTLLARNVERLKATVKELPWGGQEAQDHHWIAADFFDPTSVREAIRTEIDPTKPYHILVNNTGGPPAGNAVDATPEQFIQAFQSHLICNQLLVQSLLPGMKDAKYGRVINIISTSVKQPIPGLGVSNTIRGAVASWAKTLAGELGGFGITVNNVLPGYTNTERLRSLITGRARKQGVTEKDVAAEMTATIPVGRFAESGEIGAAIAFLASPAAGYINGINLPVDGGRLGTL
jgi:3-oxoacyl-[acyl-carrier protein] reductase